MALLLELRAGRKGTGAEVRIKPAPVAHACSPSYSGSRNQEDLGSKPAQANSLRDPILKI
jgi:hypothetical protein